MKLSKLALAAWICIVVLATLLLKGGVTNAASISQCKGWSIVSSPNVNGAYNILSGTTALSASDVWAVGDSFNTSTSIQQTLIEQWNGTSWSIISSPDIGPSDSLSGVAAVSASDVWAVGSSSNSMHYPQTLIEKWNGTQWKVVPSPNVKGDQNTLSAVTVVSANDIWTVGSSFNANTKSIQTLTEHWNGTKWSIVSSPNGSNSFNSLNGVTAVSSNDVWTVGDSYNAQTQVGQTLIEHWDGTKWSVVSSPNGGTNDTLFGVAAASANDIWAVGISSTGVALQKTLIEHWNGTQWSVVNSPSLKQHDNLLNGVAVISANDIWAVGVSSTRNPSVDQTLTEHWNGTKWSIVSSPNVQGYNDYLNGVAAFSAHNIWTVGSAFDPNNHMSSQTLTEFHC
jgi:hypothetical protein